MSLDDVGLEELYSQYDGARRGIIDWEMQVFKTLDYGGEGSRSFFRRFNHSIEAAYPQLDVYRTYQLMKGVGKTPIAPVSLNVVNLMIMERALSLGDQEVDEATYLSSIRPVYNEVGLDIIGFMFCLDEEGQKLLEIELERKVKERRFNPNDIRLLRELYRRFYDFIASDAQTVDDYVSRFS